MPPSLDRSQPPSPQLPSLLQARERLRAHRSSTYLQRSDAFAGRIGQALGADFEPCRIANELAMALDDACEACATLDEADHLVRTMDDLTHGEAAWRLVERATPAPDALDAAGIYVAFLTLQGSRLTSDSLRDAWGAAWQRAVHLHDRHQRNATALALADACPATAIAPTDVPGHLRRFLEETAASTALRLVVIAVFPYVRAPTLALLRGLDTLVDVLEPAFRLVTDSHTDLGEPVNSAIYTAACLHGVSLGQARRMLQQGDIASAPLQGQVRHALGELEAETFERVEQILAPYRQTPESTRLRGLAEALSEIYRFLRATSQKAPESTSPETG